MDESVARIQDTSQKIKIALWLLEGLVADIDQLVLGFRFLTSKIQEMLDYDEVMEDGGQDIEAKIQNGKDPRRKIRFLTSSISEMRKTAIVVRFYSELVAAVIQDLVIPGLREASKTSHTNILDDNVEQLVKDQTEKMTAYLEEADKKCYALAQGAVKLYNEEFARAVRLEQ